MCDSLVVSGGWKICDIEVYRGRKKRVAAWRTGGEIRGSLEMRASAFEVEVKDVVCDSGSGVVKYDCWGDQMPVIVECE